MTYHTFFTTRFLPPFILFNFSRFFPAPLLVFGEAPRARRQIAAELAPNYFGAEFTFTGPKIRGIQVETENEKALLPTLYKTRC